MDNDSFQSSLKFQLEDILRRKDINQLRLFGRKYGFLELTLRKRAWLQLLSIELPSDLSNWKCNTLEEQRQVEISKDVDRSLGNLSIFDSNDRETIESTKNDLRDILVAIFSKHKDISYLQGFHDIASVCLALFGKNQGFYVSEKLATTVFKDMLSNNFPVTISTITEKITQILKVADPELYDALDETYNGQFFFTVPWVVTWFGHTFRCMEKICRFWDFLLSSPPDSIIHVSVAFIIQLRGPILRQEYGDIENIQKIFQKADDYSFAFGRFFTRAQNLTDKFPEKFLGLKSHPQTEKLVLSQPSFLPSKGPNPLIVLGTIGAVAAIALVVVHKDLIFQKRPLNSLK